MWQWKISRFPGWLMVGRILTLTVALVAVMGWMERPARAAATFALPAYTNEGVAVSDNISSYANYDGTGHNYSATALAAAGFRSGAIATTHGAAFQMPRFTENVPDNWTAPTATPITIPIIAPTGSAIAFLGSATSGPSSGLATLTFSDNTTQTFTLTLSDWTLNNGASAPSAGNSIAATTSYQDTASGFTRNTASYLFFVAPSAVPSGKTLASLTLPATVTQGTLHIFSIAAIVPPPAFTNEGISPSDGATTTANFDGAGNSYSGAALSAAGFAPSAPATVGGVAFTWPSVAAGVSDNWSQAGQIVPVPAVSAGFLGFLGASVSGPSSGAATITYTDGSTQSITLTFSDWTLNNGASKPASGNSIAATTPYYDTAVGGKHSVPAYVFMTAVRLMAGKIPLSVQLPTTVNTGVMHIFAVGVTPSPTGAPLPISPQPTFGAGDWTGYLHDGARSGYNGAETILTPSTYPSLKQAWSVTAGGVISDQPAVVNGVSYWGSWDGALHATSATGSSLWTVNLGQTTDTSCDPQTAGVASSPSIGAVNGVTAVFVAGGNSRFYAVSAANGSILWSTSLGTSPSHFLWSSPLVYNGGVYEGISSFGDCPLVAGAVVRMDENTGAVMNVLHTVPSGCIGVGVWGSVTVDTTTGVLYFATGNSGSCGSAEPLAESVVAAKASNLSLISHWQIPNQATGGDIDFGSTPTLFSATINGQNRALLGIVNKDGMYFAFDRTNITAGPVWSLQVGVGGDCPQCGTADISPSAFDGSELYVASGSTSINGVSCLSSVRALNPATGAPHWQDCLNAGTILAALTVTPGVVTATSGGKVLAFNTSTGALIWSFADTTTGSGFYGATVVSNGRLYVGNVDGKFFVFALPGSAPQRHPAPTKRGG